MKRNTLIIIAAFIVHVATAQQFSPNDVKVAYIYKFASFVQWENENEISKFCIGVYDSDTTLQSEFNVLVENKTIKSKPIELVRFRKDDSIENVQLFYLSEAYVSKAEEVFHKIHGKNVLLVTDNCPNKRIVMINFISPNNEEKQNIGFEINTKSIVDNNLTILPELLLLGGTEVEKRKLFSDIQDSLKSEREKVHQQRILLGKQQKEIDEQNEKLAEQQLQINKQNKFIEIQQERIEVQKRNLSELSVEVEKRQELLQSKLERLKQTEDYIKLQEAKSKEQEAQIEMHAKTLSEQTMQIDEQKSILETQKKNLEQKTTTIRKQEYTIYLIAIILLLVIILSGYIYRSYKHKKHINNELEIRNNAIVKQNIEIQEQKEEIRAQAEELLEKNEILLELDQFKKGMTSMIVHDLKNSLNAIINLPDNISKDEKLAINKQYGLLMLHLVLNILDVNKYEEAKMDVDLRDVSLFEVSSRAIEQVHFLANQKSITIKNLIGENIAAKADEEIIERVFVNILTNAIKYSKTASDVLVESEKISNQNLLKIKIKDFGIGIPHDKKQLVFQKFGQVDAKKSGGVRSSGIGLTFCKLAVEAHGGVIDFESEPEKGTMFWFTLEQSNGTVEADDSSPKNGINEDRVELSQEDIVYLAPFIQELREYKIYEISSINHILGKIESISESVTRWKKNLRRAVDSFDKDGYALMLNKVLT